jgi:large subunit ribosomal protein L17
MRKNVFGRQFSRNTNQRKALFKALISSLILDESIKTTLQKANAIKGDVDKIINKAKKGDNKLKITLLQRHLGRDAVDKIIKDIAPRFKDRTSGYTRIIRLGRRFSDNAEMALMEWVVQKIENGKLKVENRQGKDSEKTAMEAIPAKIETHEEEKKREKGVRKK